MSVNTKSTFSKYQIFVIVILAFIQFSVVLDFMILSPLGYILMPALQITKQQFSIAVASYAFSAFLSGFIAAGFADKFDRKKLLLFFYVGFIVGTFLCGIADSYTFLIFARIVTGLFGGVIASVSNAIITDLFTLEVRGRVMGTIQISFAASQVLGLPIGLYLSEAYNWHTPFKMIVGISLVAIVVMAIYLRSIKEHLKLKNENNPLKHLLKTINNKSYIKAFAATTLLATGGYMLMPYGSDFAVHNLGIDAKEELPLFYMYTGIASIFIMPIAGRLSDSVGKYKVFFAGSLISITMVLIYCSLGQTPFWLVVLINILLFIGIMSRIAPSQAMMSAVPEAKDRGAFMSVNSSVQYLSGGAAALVAGMIVGGGEGVAVKNYDILGVVVSVAICITMYLMYLVHQQIEKK